MRATRSRTRATVMTTALLLGSGLALPLAACHDEGPAERAGEKIDQAAQDAKDAVEDAVDRDGTFEKAGRKVDEGIDAVQQEADEAKQKLQDDDD